MDDLAPIADTEPRALDPSLGEPEHLVLPSALSSRFGDIRFLGAGGMGTVYRATDRQLNRDVAIKILHYSDPETSRMLLREARALARLEHDHACKVYEVDAEGERPCIVMQFVPGQSLDKAGQHMALEEKVEVLRQVALALHEAHRLGIVHRDVKPGNIMVERADNGKYKAYIMDFGIAREIGRTSQTYSSFAGTPSYMAPEQATGDVAAMDRRTDVYSLGATLYDVVAGRAPFEGSNPVAVLQKLLIEEALPLRKACQDVPADLEAIVMKCLEKEPKRRYDSAKAFADDLQRFLADTPVMARPPSLTYRAYKFARRHKVRVTLVSLLVVMTLIIGAVLIREQREIAQQAAISQELGEDLKEMELFLSRAYGLPLHDIERERRIVHEQLREIETRMNRLGKAAEGPGNYALGRGFLALHENEQALVHLRRAETLGYAPPELRYALGLTLAELYRVEREKTKRIQDEKRRQQRIAELDAEYKEPALACLRMALGAKLTSPAYAEGLIALHEGRFDIALERARVAFEQAPWLYEAKKLEGDALFAQGKLYGRDAAFDYDKMMASFKPAAAAYEEAGTIARSDPVVHEAQCELWTQVVVASDVRLEQLRPSFDQAKAACEKSIAADPQRISARLTMAFAHHVFAWNARNGLDKEEPERIIAAAIEQAEDVARRWEDDAMAQYLVGGTHRTALVYLLNRGLDARHSLNRSIAAHEKAIRLDPTFLWPYNEVCASYGERIQSEIWQGIDPSRSVELGVAHCNQAITLDPSFTFPAISKAFAFVRKAQYLVGGGQSPEEPISEAIGAANSVKDRNPLDANTISAWALWLRGAYECDAGKDPEESLRQVEALLREKQQLEPTSAGDELEGLVALTRGLHRLRKHEDPTPETAKASTIFAKIISSSPWDVDYRVDLARTETIQLRWLLDKKTTGSISFAAAFEPLLILLDKERANPNLYQTLAQIYELQARFEVVRKRSAAEEVKKGLDMATKALALNPKMASALAVKGALWLQAARSTQDETDKKRAAKEAVAALTNAIAENPLLGLESGRFLEEAQRLCEAK